MHFFFVCLHFNWNGWKVVWGVKVVSVLKRIKKKIKAYKLGGYKVMLEDVPPPPESSSIYRKKTSRTPVSHTTGRKNITDVAIPTEPEWRRHLLFVSSEEQERMSQIPTSLAFLCPFQATWSSYTVTPQHKENSPPTQNLLSVKTLNAIAMLTSWKQDRERLMKYVKADLLCNCMLASLNAMLFC